MHQTKQLLTDILWSHLSVCSEWLVFKAIAIALNVPADIPAKLKMGLKTLFEMYHIAVKFGGEFNLAV